MSIVVNKRPYDRNWSGNPIAYELYSAAAAGDPSIYFEVRLMFKYVGGSYAEIVRLPYNPVAGVATVKLHDILHSVLEYGLPDLAVDETLSYIGANQTGYFFLSYREVTGTPVAFDDSEVDFPLFVIKGGISYMKWRGNNYWENLFDPSSPFLTWQLSGRLAALTERMYLAWLNHTAISAPTLKARATVYYSDGGATQTLDFTLLSSAPDIVSFIPVGAEQLGLSAIEPARAIWYWEIKVMDHTDPGTPVAVSETFTYYADNRKDYNDTTLNYRNSLGGIDSARIRGVIEHNLDYENETISKVTAQDYFDGSRVTPQLEMLNNQERTIYKGDIGYLPKDDQDRLRDAHLQREVWWEVDLKWWPVLNVTGNLKQRKSDDNKWSLPSEWTAAIPGDAFYTPKDAATGDGEANTNVCAGSVSDVMISWPSAPAWDLEFNATITGATQFTYQVIGFHSAPITDLVANLPVSVPGLTENQNYTLEIRALCANGATGKPSRTAFTTAEVSFDSSLYNYAEHYEIFDVYIDNVVIHSTNLNQGEWDVFNCGTTGVKDVKVGYLNGAYTTAKLICAAGTYFGTVGVVEATWDDIDITGGFTIEMY